MAARYNVVIVGKTGVGKSSLVNYLYGENIRKVGVGKPVTEKGFHKTDFDINGLPVTLFDSWGLEAGKSDDWKKSLESELCKRGASTSAEQWYHTVLYCVSAGGARIEDFELDIISKFIRDKYKVTVILTKADQSSQEELDELQATLKRYIRRCQVPMIPTCSEGKTLLGGGNTKRFGKKEIEVQAYKDFWDSIALRLPDRCIYVLNAEIDKWETQQKRLIKEQGGFLLEDNPVRSKLKKETERFVANLNNDSIVFDEIQKTLRLYKMLSDSLGYPPVSLRKSTIRINVSFPDSTTADWFKDALSGLFLPVTLFFQKTIIKGRLTECLEKVVQALKKEVPKVKPKIKKLINSLKTSK